MLQPMSRRDVLRAVAGGAAVVATGTAAASPAGAAGSRVPGAVRELEEKIKAGMAAYGIPGVSYALRYQGREYLGGFGVTDVTAPQAVTGETAFRIASTTKTFTGTAVMRLVERGRIDLDDPVRRYLPGFRTSDEAASRRVTVRQVLNHSAGWLGDHLLDTGSDDGALTRYVASMATLPQLTAPGTVFAYNNAAISLAGRLIEVATGRTYERALRELVLDPLRLRQTAFLTSELPGVRVASGHGPGGQPGDVPVPRSLNAAGGLYSTARDQLRWARYHLGDGSPLLSRRALRAMRWRPGPGGTLFVELDGAGVTWMLRPTAEGPRVVQHGGDWPGHHSGFLLVPERDFALTVLTNSEGGPGLTAELFSDDWALSRFAGLHNLPARPRVLPAAQLTPYEGSYEADQIGFGGEHVTQVFEVVAADGRLILRIDGQDVLALPFYRKDYVLMRGLDGSDAHSRANFVRNPDGSIGWLRLGGRLYRRNPAATTSLRTTSTPPRLVPVTLPYPVPSS